MEKVLDRNLQPSASKSMHMIYLYGAPTYVDWVSTNTTTERLTALLTTLWQETRLIMAELISLMSHNSW